MKTKLLNLANIVFWAFVIWIVLSVFEIGTFHSYDEPSVYCKYNFFEVVLND